MTQTLHETTKTAEIIMTPKGQAPYFIRIESETEPGKFYDIHYNFVHRVWACPCPDAQGSRHNPRCKHWRAAMRLLDERRAAKRAQTPATPEEMAQAVADLHEEIDSVRCSAARAAENAQDDLTALSGDLDTATHQAKRDIADLQAEVDELRDEIAKLRAELATKATKRISSTREQREKAPLNGNREFSILKK